MNNQRKEEIMNSLIDHICDCMGVNECIEILRNVASITNDELYELNFDPEAIYDN